MTERVAGGQHDHAPALGDGGVGPLRHPGERAIHASHLHSGDQVRVDQIERALGADNELRGAQVLTRGIGQAGPAVVEDTDQANAVHAGFSSSRSPTRTMNSPSKSQASTVSRYGPG